jgi:diaphanous 1
MPPAKIRAALWEIDDEVLDVDQLSMVSRMLPTHDEVSSPVVTILLADALFQIEKINRFDGDRAKLAKPEQFLIEVYRISITYCSLL